MGKVMNLLLETFELDHDTFFEQQLPAATQRIKAIQDARSVVVDELTEMDELENVEKWLQTKGNFLFTRWQMCEPEMWLFTYQYDTLFEEVAAEYSDFPTDILGREEGHMSF